MNQKLRDLLKQNEKYAIELRRHFHQHPEASLNEKETVKRICKELDDMGIPYKVLSQGNVVAVINEGKPGKKLAIRADIDALVMPEELDVPWKSQNDGLMHACGHDAHTGALLGLAKSLLAMKDELSGSVYLCFQVAEEVAEGAVEIVEYLKSIGGVDQAIGTHVMADLPSGIIAIPEGPMLSGVKTFDIEVDGRGGHGSRPDLCIDPIKPAADILLKITSIPAWRISPFDTCVISPCMIHAGTARNIVPDKAVIGGNIRYYSYEAMDQMEAVINEICDNAPKAFGTTAKFTVVAGNPPVINTPELARKGKEIAAQLGYEVAPPTDPTAGSDNFAEFVRAFTGFYIAVGATSDREGTSSNHHNVRFDIDEKSIFATMDIMGHYALDFLK